ncbi:MAG TPA: 50S ribosomal protein L25 [Chitinophagales bacterium]|jgi:large subunit ribosomal protein L25|nr:50S ribosomal protein L25 [Chitinophagales bacterium]MBP6153663.1 50S ribosomal protein L25 [Chitinophagales bacterium]HQV79088.1 50S ribosomal protein L25 [Chitinophagales bacterium]HQW79788.1 50S ribosomal protein L25 [Chitinophagales bacterium]HRB19907.1 50S ribosomal protein L25 [Chitinophagales bacterium]
MQTITISGKARQNVGKVATKADRAAGNIPCVMYAGNEVVHFTSTISELRGILYTPKFYKAIINIEGTTHEALLKDVQSHPITEEILHIDFHKLTPGAKVIVEIPIRIIGQSPGVKEGGKLLVKVRKVKVKAAPEDLKDAIDIDISELKLGQSFKVRDIKTDGLEILNSPAIPLVSVEVTRALKSAATEAAKAATSAKKK